MKKSKWQGLASVVVAFVLASSWAAGPALAKKLEGKLRTRTGVLLDKAGARLSIQGTKQQGDLEVILSPDTRIILESPAGIEKLEKDSLVRITGKGARNTLSARQVVVLPSDQALRMSKQTKKGPAYPLQDQKTETKVKILSLKPFEVMNRHQQTLRVIPSNKTEYVQQSLTNDNALKAGVKVTVKYRESGKAHQAREVIVRTAEKVKQVKK